MSHDIMIDLETLGTTADAVILSIGAVRFDLDAGHVTTNTFYCVTSIESQPKRAISKDTLAWWSNQTAAAFSVFTEHPKTSLSTALDEFYAWFKSANGDPIAWSNGADFDLPMLSQAYADAGKKQPWQPYSGRCYRTYKNLPGARAITVERKGEHHNALDDAIYQAEHLCAIHKALFEPSVEVAKV